jgi:hypothetical protein
MGLPPSPMRPRSPPPGVWQGWWCSTACTLAPFQRALLEAEAQRAASAYIHELRHPQAEAKLSANRYEKLLGMLSRFGPQPWLTPAKAAGYLAAWSAPGALTGILNWFRPAPLLVPKVGESILARCPSSIPTG